MKRELRQSKESAASTLQELQEVKRKVNELQQVERKLTENVNQKSLAKGKLEKEVRKAQDDAQLAKKEKERAIEQLNQVENFISTTNESLSDLYCFIPFA